MKRICILVVVLAIVWAQDTRVRMAEGQFMIPTIAIHDQDVLEVPTTNQNPQNEMVRDDRGFWAPKVDENQAGHPMLGGEENMMPIIGRDEFNPFEFRPENGFNERPNHPRPNHRRPQMRHQDGKEEFGMGPRDREISDRIEGDWERIEFRSNPQPVPNHDDWQRHVEGNHMEKSRYHKRIRCMLIGTAVVFTLVGLCLAKCCRRCQKNRKERIRAMIMRSRTAQDINQEIKQEERKLDQLKTEYANKRAEQERVRRQQQAQNQAYQMHMRQRQMQQPRVYYAQPYAVQEAYYNPRTQIPMGRPINQSNNSSFATEYPQL